MTPTLFRGKNPSGRAYDIMRSDRESLNAGETARKEVQYQSITANLPDTQWLGAKHRSNG
jgi:hypothetical protein